jgi:hypothetical protein
MNDDYGGALVEWEWRGGGGNVSTRRETCYSATLSTTDVTQTGLKSDRALPARTMHGPACLLCFVHQSAIAVQVTHCQPSNWKLNWPEADKSPVRMNHERFGNSFILTAGLKFSCSVSLENFRLSLLSKKGTSFVETMSVRPSVM